MLTKRRLNVKRFLARPVSTFFFSALATFGVWFFTFPARAKLPCTLPIAAAAHANRAPQRAYRVKKALEPKWLEP
eukprot:CAMPEP_0183388922 /NCGR_PEP_ID=MMETSP0370-20130417/4522_1 /TAXON_ID=268820 /ORGANISM="Peridinium aciculiferum, Strain PAER-2" /LENGTH=74 /DNA_ID=CAMNT_0025568033 /DNA_START=224 /DNA_END=445 /DNA_ORIENTATION=+